jgi:uncharacterized protein
MEKGNFIIRTRRWIILFTGLIVVSSLALLTRITINPDLESYLPASVEAKVSSDTISKYFGSDNMIILVFEAGDVLSTPTLQRLSTLSGAFNTMKEIENVISLFDAKDIKGVEGQMVVESVVKEIPGADEEREVLRDEIKANDMVYNLIVSKDFHYTLMILTAREPVDDKVLMEQISQKLAEFPGKESVSINGQPFLRDEANRRIGKDLMLLLPVCLLIMFLFLWISLKEMRGVVLPFSVVVISTLIALALIPLFGWELSIIGVLLPIMMIAIANNYGIYFIAKYQELNATKPGITMEEIATESFNYLKKPVIFCGLTTIAGVMGLTTHILKPASQMGVVSGIAVGFALLLSLLYIPSMMSLMKKGRIQIAFSGKKSQGILMSLKKAGVFTIQRPRWIVIIFTVFIVITSAGLLKLKTASDHNNILPENHSFNKSLAIMNSEFGGNKMINILFEGDIKDPVILMNLDRYEKELEKMPGVGSVISIATVLRKMSTVMNDPGDLGYDRIPDSRDLVAQYFELYSMSGDPEDFENMVDFDFTRALLTIQYQAGSMKEINHLLDRIYILTKGDTHLSRIGGYSLIDRAICQSVATGQYYSLLFAFVIIFILLSIIFRSLTAGFMGSLPLVFAVVCTFGIMGWTGIDLNIVTALLSSVSIGMGVDFTIQMFWKIKTEIANGHTYGETLKIAWSTIGRGICINAFSVMVGFSVLFLSTFPIIRSFAFLIIISLFLCLTCAMVLIPALSLLLKPGFLGKEDKQLMQIPHPSHPPFSLHGDSE